jgi:hypothetical protein
VNLAGAHFYTSSAFWGVAPGVIIGLLGMAVTTWVTLRATYPKRRLYYMVQSDAPTITGREEFFEQLKISHGHMKLKSPRLVTIRLVSHGWLDISREAFDEGKPLSLDIGTPIVDLVKVTTSPSDRVDPSWTLEGSMLLIGPSHFGRRQTTEFSLLIDGMKPHIVAPKQTLIDVSIEPGDGQTLPKERIIQGALVVFTAMFSNSWRGPLYMWA